MQKWRQGRRIVDFGREKQIIHYLASSYYYSFKIFLFAVFWSDGIDCSATCLFPSSYFYDAVFSFVLEDWDLETKGSLAYVVGSILNTSFTSNWRSWFNFSVYFWIFLVSLLGFLSIWFWSVLVWLLSFGHAPNKNFYLESATLTLWISGLLFFFWDSKLTSSWQTVINFLWLRSLGWHA